MAWKADECFVCESGSVVVGCAAGLVKWSGLRFLDRL